jgi:hypothetical protein
MTRNGFYVFSAVTTGTILSYWAGVGILRIFLAPVFGGFFFLSGLFASSREARMSLFLATLLEAVSFVGAAGLLFLAAG